MSDINVTTPQLKEIHVHNSKNRIKESKAISSLPSSTR